jgi:hypothetical protein
MEILPSSQEDGFYMRTVSTPIEPDSLNWTLAGLQSAGALPPVEVIELIDDIRIIFPLIDNSLAGVVPESEREMLEGIDVRWTPPRGPQSGPEVVVRQNMRSEEGWSAATDVASRAAEVEGLAFRYVAGRQEFRMLTSSCDGRVDQSSNDEELFDAVLANGAEVLMRAGRVPACLSSSVG